MSSTIGILGAGQLGRMLALAGYPLGLRFRFFDPDPRAPSRYLAGHDACGFDDVDALEKFAESVDLITYEFENVPISAACLLENRRPIYPSPRALETSQDRLVEKRFLRKVAIPTTAFAPIDCSEDVESALDVTGLPALLKTRRMGYDGKGQHIVRTREGLTTACVEMGNVGLILEAFVPFAAEFSLISVRAVSGETKFYPLIENVHNDGILRTSRIPSAAVPVTPQMQAEAEHHADALLTALNYVGVLTVEYFVVNGELMANEIAPRVHNSGHWTIEGAETSQFENHLRAILDLPLGSTEVLGHIGMINIIGNTPNISDVMQVTGAHLHLYDKSPRPNRKIGHITVRANSDAELDIALERLATVL